MKTTILMKRILYFIIVCSFFSCDIINPEEDIPAFLEIESFSFNSIPNSGSNLHDIKEGWVFVDDDLIGAFIPGKPFPILKEGTVEVIIQAGIHEDGISVATKIYPYMDRYITTVDLVPGEITTVSPEFQYRDNIDFFLIEEFENSTFFTDDRSTSGNPDVTFEELGAFEGLSGKIVLTADNPEVNIATSQAFALPTISSADTYLEINFKTDVPIAIGLVASDGFGGQTQIYANGLNSTPEWKKVYINVQESIANIPSPAYQVGFGAELPFGLTEATIMIDNIKLLHFIR
jgi:hypothetical protein